MSPQTRSPQTGTDEQSTRRGDEGFSLIELLVTTMLLGLVLAVVVSIYASTSQVERTVNSVTTSATDAQLAATSIERGVRSASEVRLSGVGSTLLVARVPGSADTISWSCVAWYYSASGDGKVYTRTFADGTVVAEPDSAALSDWTLLLDDVDVRSGTSIFSAAGRQITVSFDAIADDHPPVAIQLTAEPLTPVEMETSQCS
jgi:prepilin-type N-terminal cleavage/methylation domain-containing protein